jgi:gamma-glutamyl hercynylcysteine S-oxide synthase
MSMATDQQAFGDVPAGGGIAAEAVDLRMADAAALKRAWTALRERRWQLWQAYTTALPATMTVRYLPEINPPLWELGHIAWFEEYWLGRNPHRGLGAQADPEAPRAAPCLPGADALYNSSTVAHTRRWRLDLPDARRTWAMADRIRERSLSLLVPLPGDDQSLYFPRWVAVHEAMHLEAWIYMAQTLAIDLHSHGLAALPAAAATAPQTLALLGQSWTCGHDGPGLVLDNECPPVAVALAPFEIDNQPVSWGRYLPFVEAGGYDEPRWWSAEGWAWRQQHSPGWPRYLHREAGVWRRAAYGHWVEVQPESPAVHLSAHEAQAWCRWAGRRLPTEAEWECAALSAGPAFAWGEVWEWTASAFTPYPGFAPHPYRDYSQPWFDGRPVLRGASAATWPGMRHPRYRNYFPAERNDILAGFRSCASAATD